MMQLTNKQKEAVSSKDQQILVSAAAGSGKTSVLSLRITKLCEEGADIRKMLIATFTNLAAFEMRDRISKRLLERAEETNNLRLKTQAEYALSSDICTIHKFCSNLIRENYMLVGIPQNWRTAEDSYTDFLKQAALEETFSELYEAENEYFLCLVKRFSKERERTDASLRSYILSIYKFAMSLPEGILFLKNTGNMDTLSYLKDYLPEAAEKEIEKEAEFLKEQANMFLTVLSAFESHYKKIKISHAVLDFSDIMHFAYEILQHEEVEKSYRERYTHVFIDEYQDTDAIQEAVLEKISKHNNLFMVGDIKQSIYRFRLADPLIFLNKAQKFACEAEGEKLIRMNDNFRSASAVVATVNYVMSKLMSKRLGEIEYTQEEELICNASKEGSVSLLLTETGKKTEEDSFEDAEKEAITIASRIQQMVKEEHRSYEDIAVLTRSNKDTDLFLRVFQNYGIPCFGENHVSDSQEEALFLALLHLIEETSSDIALLSVLRSYLGAFDEEEIACIRIRSEKERFYHAFLECAQKEDILAKKARSFLEKLERFRLMKRSMRLKDFLIAIKNETLYEEYLAALPGGTDKSENFRRFFSACLAEAETNESLFTLLYSIDSTKKQTGSYIRKEGGSAKEGGICLLSIHKSKGLEFPVVFLARMNKQFNTRNLGNNLLCHATFGVVTDLQFEETRTKRASLIKKGLHELLLSEFKSEELRILYVAMTRAKEQLILSGCTKERAEFFEKTIPALLKATEPITLKSPLEWVLFACLPLNTFSDWTHMEGEDFSLQIEHRIIEPISLKKKKEETSKTLPEKKNIPEKTLLSYHPTRTLCKVGVSSLLPEFFHQEGMIAPKPFTLNGAGLGTAVHLFLQHLDFSSKAPLNEMLSNMQAKYLLSEEEAASVMRYLPKIESFLNSTVAKRIQKAQTVLREVPFSIAIPGNILGISEHDDDVLVQGIIDLLFLEDDKWVIVDYKSNAARKEDISNLKEHYTLQVTMYRRALELVSEIPVKESILYFLSAETFVTLT